MSNAYIRTFIRNSVSASNCPNGSITSSSVSITVGIRQSSSSDTSNSRQSSLKHSFFAHLVWSDLTSSSNSHTKVSLSLAASAMMSLLSSVSLSFRPITRVACWSRGMILA